MVGSDGCAAKLAPILAVSALGVAIAACSANADLLSQTPLSANVAKAGIAINDRPMALVALAPIQGPPESVASRLIRQLNQAAMRKKIALISDAGLKSTYALRGFVLTTVNNGRLVVSYLWDVLDKTGRRVSRISGEEDAGPAPNKGDHWSAVSAAQTLLIADRTANALDAAIGAAARRPNLAERDPS